MNGLSDQQLLHDYAEHGSEAAFAEVVRRHIDLVYSAALRMVRDSHLAQDVTQGAFIALAQNAGRLADRSVLSGWLHVTAQNLAAKAVRSDVRRRAREQEAAAMNESLSAEPDASWEQIAPHLDVALAELSEADRDALLLRYFERKSARQMAEALGVSQEAAQKRVARGVERLRESLAKRGVSVGASALAAVVSANAVQAAPTGLALTVSTAAFLKETAFAASAAVPAVKTVAMTTIQKALIGATAAVLIGTAVYQTRQAAHLRARMEALQQHTSSLSNEAEQLEQERDAATNRLAVLAAEVGRYTGNSAELLRLRGEVGRLRAESQALARLAARGPGAEPGSEETAWLERVRLLKQTLDQMPGAKIPEFQFLTHYEWLTAAKHKLETEDDYTAAFKELRASAVANFVRTAEIALQKYGQANDGRFPADLAQLKSFFETPPDDEVLDRYKIVPPGGPQGADPAQNTNEWAITLKSPQDGGNWRVTPSGSSTFVDSPQMAILAPAMKAALDAAPVINGAKRLDIHQLAPYLTTSEQRAAYEELLRNSK